MRDDIWDRFDALKGAYEKALSYFPHGAIHALFWIYPRHNPHPTAQALLAWLKNPKEPLPCGSSLYCLGRGLYQGVKGFLFCLYVDVSSLFTRFFLLLFGPRSTQFRGGIVAKTWHLTARRPVGSSDFYYGDLDARLEKEDIPLLRLTGNATGLGQFRFSFLFGKKRAVPEWGLLGFLDGVKAFLLAFYDLLRVSWAYAVEKDRPVKAVLGFAIQDMLRPETMRALLNRPVFRNAVKKWRPRAVMTLYEGHAWEKFAWKGAREGDSGVALVGYQHTVLFRESAALLTPFSSGLTPRRPDIVLCIGDVNAQLLQSQSPSGNVKYLSFGTFRRTGLPADRPADPALKTVLVTPEGIPEEMILLFTFASRCAALDPDLRFILRCHPVYPFEKIKPRLPAEFHMRANMEVSTRPMEEDFQRSAWLLNRRSSTALHGVLSGLNVFAYIRPDYLESNPLNGMPEWGDICRTPEEFLERVRNDAGEPPQNRAHRWAKAKEFVMHYAVPVTDQSIHRFREELEKLN